MSTYAEFLATKRRSIGDVGVELKPSYWQVACNNLRKAEYEAGVPSLFDSDGE